jgi:hypothetical protein
VEIALTCTDGTIALFKDNQIIKWMKEKEWKEHGRDTKPNLAVVVLELTNFR